MVNYALKVVAPVLRGEADEVEVTAKAENVYLDRVQAASADRVWNRACGNVR